MVSVISPFYLTYCFTEVLSGAIRGTGESIGPMVITLIGTCLFRIIWMFTVVPELPGLLPIIILYPITWILTSAMLLIYYFSRKKRGLI